MGDPPNRHPLLPPQVGIGPSPVLKPREVPWLSSHSSTIPPPLFPAAPVRGWALVLRELQPPLLVPAQSQLPPLVVLDLGNDPGVVLDASQWSWMEMFPPLAPALLPQYQVHCRRSQRRQVVEPHLPVVRILHSLALVQRPLVQQPPQLPILRLGEDILPSKVLLPPLKATNWKWKRARMQMTRGSVCFHLLDLPTGRNDTLPLFFFCFAAGLVSLVVDLDRPCPPPPLACKTLSLMV